MVQQSYLCPKCGNTNHELAEIRVAGGFWSKIFDVQGSKYTAVVCSRCKYTEFYKGTTKTLENVFDFLTS